MIFDLLKSAADNAKNQVAIQYSDHKISYTDLITIINKLANGLYIQGIKKGSQVAIILPNTPHFIFSYYAILKLGAIAIPVNPLSDAGKLQHIFEHIQPSAVFIWEGFYNKFIEYIKDIPTTFVLGENKIKNTMNLQSFMASSPDAELEDFDIEETDGAVITWTSGISGHPKPITLTHGNLKNVLVDCYDVIPSTHSDIFGCILPLFLLYTQILVMNLALTRGSMLALYPKINSDILKNALLDDGISILVAGSGLYEILIQEFQNNDKSADIKLKYCYSIGSSCSDKIKKQFEDIFNVPILEGYGLTEASAIVSFNRIMGRQKQGTVGLPLSTLEVQIVDDNGKKLNPGELGEIAIRGKSVVDGYMSQDEPFPASDGWFHTNDIGKIDEDGFLWFYERKEDIITKGGFNIYPTEVEDILKEHPKIEELCIVGIPHETFKQEVKACIVLKNGESATVDEFADFCKDRIPVYKCPQIFQFYKSLPRNSTGKVIRKKLREEH